MTPVISHFIRFWNQFKLMRIKEFLVEIILIKFLRKKNKREIKYLNFDR